VRPRSCRNIGAGHDLAHPRPRPPCGSRSSSSTRAGPRYRTRASEKRIGRDLAFADGAWQERSDTRIAPGDSAILVDGWAGARAAGAVAARFTLTVRPDDYYERFYPQRLAAQPPGRAAARAVRAGVARARRVESYVAEDRRVPR